jgi:hypothetical protein
VPATTALPTSVAPQTIQEVIARLDKIIAWCIERKSRIGYFASLYRQMTIAVQHGINTGLFSNPKRMENLDVIFANRYLSAWEAYTSKQPCTNAWCAAFDACDNGQLVVLQHLILGINTHINLDLGIAAAQTAPGDSIYALQSDFEKINDIITIQSQKMQDTLTRIWFPLKFINRIANKQEDAVLNFSIRSARQASWANAVALAISSGQAHSNYINLIDNSVVAIARKVINPGFYASCLLRPVRTMEDKNVANIIAVLQKG